MGRFYVLVLLGLVTTACDRGADVGGPRYADIDKARVRIVAGDGQSAPVATAEARAGDLVPGAYTLAQTAVEDQYDLFPEVLEVYVGVGTLASGDPVAPGTDVHWIVRDEGCGRPVGQTTSTDADGRAVNRWIRGTRARACHMDVCRILSDGALACDTTFVAVQEPGPPDMWIGSMPSHMLVGEIAAGPYLVDRYKNAIPTLLVGRGALESVDSLRLRAARWGLGTYDVILADTVFSEATQEVAVYPDLAAVPLWTAELVCEAPEATYMDRIEFQVEQVLLRAWGSGPDSTMPTPRDVAENNGLSGELATLVATRGVNRLFLADGDTLYDLATADTALYGAPITDGYRTSVSFPGPLVILADTTVLLWPTYERDMSTRGGWYDGDWPARLPYLTGEDQSYRSIVGLPAVLDLVSDEPLTWSSGDAVEACHSEGWASATRGALTVRAGP